MNDEIKKETKNDVLVNEIFLSKKKKTKAKKWRNKKKEKKKIKTFI